MTRMGPADRLETNLPQIQRGGTEEDMVSINEVLAAVAGKLERSYPGECVYLGQTPEQFSRPSWLVSPGKGIVKDASMDNMLVTLPVVVTVFVESGEPSNSRFETLIDRMQHAMELFAAGYLNAGDRALHVVRVTGECLTDRAEITVTLQYQDTRPGPAEEYSLMGRVLTAYST